MQAEWIWALGGGLAIGTAAGAYLLGLGKIMGISGILGELIDGTHGPDRGERLWFCAGLILVPGLLAAAFGGQTHLTGSLWTVILAGLLVGFGTRLANGCTSGHGVCGMARLSLRSIVASAAYVGAGMAMVGALRLSFGGL